MRCSRVIETTTQTVEENSNDSTNQDGIPSPDSGREAPVVVESNAGTSEGTGVQTSETNAGEQGKDQNQTVRCVTLHCKEVMSPILVMLSYQEEKFVYATDWKLISKEGKRLESSPLPFKSPVGRYQISPVRQCGDSNPKNVIESGRTASD